MESSTKRSASVVAAAVVAILSGLFALLACSMALLGSLLMKVPESTPVLPPFVRTGMLAAEGFMMAVSFFGIATGIGLLYLRKWARISILIWGGFSAFFGLVGMPLVFFTRFPPTPNTPALTPESMQVFRWILLVIYGLPFLIGVWWLILFTRKSVKVQFAGTISTSDLGLPQKPSCPLPIAILAWVYVASILNLFFLPLFSYRFPLFIFGRLIHGKVGLILFILSCLAFFVAGIGLLKLKPWGYSLTLGLQFFWLASAAATLLTPNYKVAMDSYLKELQASMHMPETQFSPATFSLNYGWGVFLGLLLAAAILGLLFYYRPRFLDAARARAAS